MTFDPRQPYNDLPPLPPSVDVETKAVLKRSAAAQVALAELKGAGCTIPNQAMLVNSLVLQEAQASSEIENIFTTSDTLFRSFAAGSGQVDVATKEVLRYRQALWAGYEALGLNASLTTDVFIRIVGAIDGSAICVAVWGRCRQVVTCSCQHVDDIDRSRRRVDTLVRRRHVA